MLLYKNINTIEFNSGALVMQAFTKNEIDRINVLSPFEFEADKRMYIITSLIINDRFTVHLHVYKTTDEWYYIRYNSRIKIDRIVPAVIRFYKCDQLDGFVSFLKEKNNEINSDD